MDNAGAGVKAACRLSCDMAIDRPMKKADPKLAEDRAARLAEALRANLRRRKAEARGVADPQAAPDKPDQ